MPSIKCPIADCTYSTGNVDPAIAAALLTVHNNVHVGAAAPAAGTKQKAPKLMRPTISSGSSEETWNAFLARWNLFKSGTQLTPIETAQQLFQCCDEALGNDLLRGHPNIVATTDERELLKAVKRLAVIPVAISVRRSDLLSIRQCDGETIRTFFARIKGKAATCAYYIDCPQTTCHQSVDFTDIIVKDVLISGLAEDEIKREVLGWAGLDASTIDQTVSFLEAKEMAREALHRHSTTNSVSSYRQSKKQVKKDHSKTNCQSCDVEMERFSWSKRHKKLIERKFCITCWQRIHPRSHKDTDGHKENAQSDAGAVAVGSITSPLALDHMLFQPGYGWRRAESMRHPTLKLTVSVDQSDYRGIHHPVPKVKQADVTVVTDTGAQSCLWGLADFLRCGFNTKDLLPVKHILHAANKEEIDVLGAILIRLSGTTSDGNRRTAAVMAYVSPNTQRFYLSREALIQLGVISDEFPRVGSADEERVIEEMGAVHKQSTNDLAPCGCSSRTLPPLRPKALPFGCTKENIPKMREWLLEHFSSSTFNQCKHQQLPGMPGPSIKLHVNPNATPSAVHTPAPVPLHWQEPVLHQLEADVAMGVIEKVPLGEPSAWCHRMVLARKPDGSPRRTVDLSPLNTHCLRETHHIKPPFQQAKAVPPHTWKSVTDAWNGFHSVPIHPADRHYTTFITPWGRYRYKVAPQGFLASGDGYARRFDEVIADVERKSKCVDDTIMWDDDNDLEGHWWRMVDFLIVCGKNGIILNREKFQFCLKTVQFAGFCITPTELKPLDKFIRAIKGFPTPRKLADIRSWFGLINQVGHYNKLCSVMVPFKPFLSPKNQFIWNEQLDLAFRRSKDIIVDAIKEGVEIFDPQRLTCLRPDWSKTGIGFFLSQKHCSCSQQFPGCCSDGWKITLAGSRFLQPGETRYAPVEGEALAIAWSLEQTRYFTQGCDNLLVITDHKPLTKLFGDRTLDEITNPRLLRIKQRTLLWRFSIKHMPGKDNQFSDATSRHPVEPSEDVCYQEMSLLSPLRVHEDAIDNMETELAVVAAEDLRAITWEIVRSESTKDQQIQTLINTITSGIPLLRDSFPANIQDFWKYRDDFYVIDGVVLFKKRIVIPKALRSEVLQTLHSAHQGVTAMNERAKVEVYWPGITRDIQSTRNNCYDCNRTAPSQARLPPYEPIIPTTPFEMLACDYFLFKGWYYLVAADRLSCWPEIFRIRQGTSESGSSGLCSALRQMFSTFGVPIEISSDGGPEFAAQNTESFFRRWGIHHRKSSSYLPSSNGRAEVAVKSAKRLLMSNISANGTLDSDKMVRALLTLRNTPDSSCKLSPAEIIFGRRLRDTLPGISKEISTHDNPHIACRWKEAWNLRERSLKERYVRSSEALNQHTRTLDPLCVGDNVFIQNQTGSNPTRWDRSGVVMESKDFDQYLVKVAGSGRLTLRNRRFLRKFTPHDLYNSNQLNDRPNHLKVPAPFTPLVDPGPYMEPTPATSDTGHHHHDTYQDTASPGPTKRSERMHDTVQIPHEQPKIDDAPPSTPHLPEPPMEVRRSARVRNPKKIYEPETGTYLTKYA